MADGQTRAPGLAIIGAVLIFACLSAVGYRGALRSIEALAPAGVDIVPAMKAYQSGVALRVATTHGKSVALDPSPSGRWRFEKRPVQGLTLVLPIDWRDWLERVTIQIGDYVHEYDRAAFQAAWRRVEAGSEAVPEAESWAAPAENIGRTGVAAARFGAINWPSDLSIALRTLAFPTVFSALVVLILVLAWRQAPASLMAAHAAFERWEGKRTGAPPQHVQVMERAWAAFGLGVVASAFILLQRIDPFYFSQDDNLTQFMPVILHGCELLNHDFWPDYNLHQLMGAPMASTGIYGLSYPLLWAACAVADGILDIDTAVLEVYAGLHLGLGFIATFALGRQQGLSAQLAAALGLSFVLCGYFLIGGRSWYYMLPVALWLPLLLLSAARLATTQRPIRWIITSGLAIGLFFHAGNAQMWVYGLLAWGGVIVFRWYRDRSQWRRLFWAASAGVFGLGISAPLLVPQFSFVGRLLRDAAQGNGIWNGIGALFLPYPIIRAGHPNGWGDPYSGTMSQFYYSGTVLSLAGLIVIVALIVLWLRRGADATPMVRPWPLFTAIAFVLALGTPALLWPLLELLPVFRHFTHPFKALPYLVLFLNLTGALALHAWLGRRGKWHSIVTLVVAVLMIWHVGLSRQSFFTIADDPYPAFPDALATLMQPSQNTLDGRVMSASPLGWPAPGFTATLSNNFATRHRLMAIDGYGSMVAFTPENLAVQRRFTEAPEAARQRYGVRWLVRYLAPVDETAPIRHNYTAWDGSLLALAYRPAFAGGTPVAQSGDLVLYDLGPADPMAFYSDEITTPLPARADGNRVVVDLQHNQHQRNVTLNFLHRPSTYVEGDGQILPAGGDEWGRVFVGVPPGTRQLVLGYNGGWGRGLFYAAVLMLVAMAIAVVAISKDPEFGQDRDGKEA